MSDNIKDVVTPITPITPITTEKLPTPPVPVVTIPVVQKYKLNLYTASGTIKPVFLGGVMRDVHNQFDDIINSMSSTEFMTENEIIKSVHGTEIKLRRVRNSTIDEIKYTIQQLLDRQIIVTD